MNKKDLGIIDAMDLVVIDLALENFIEITQEFAECIENKEKKPMLREMVERAILLRKKFKSIRQSQK